MGQICAWNSNNSYTALYQKTAVFHKDYTTLQWLVNRFWPVFLSKFSISYWCCISLSPLTAISQAWSKGRLWSFIFSGAFPSHLDFNCPPSLQDEACIWPTEINSMYHSLLLSELHMVILNIKIMFKTRLWNMIFDYISWSRSVASSLPRKVISCASVSRSRTHNQRQHSGWVIPLTTNNFVML